MSWIIMIYLVAALLRPVGCPDLPIGTLGTLRSGDALDGRPVEVFQPAWTITGEPTYIVRLLDHGGGYLGATGCQIEVR